MTDRQDIRRILKAQAVRQKEKNDPKDWEPARINRKVAVDGNRELEVANLNVTFIFDKKGNLIGLYGWGND